jgi:spore coat protein U-like protein
MKKLTFVTALSLLSASTLPSFASTATNTFDTNTTLTSACVIDSATAVTFTYTSFQTAASTASPSDIVVRCTNTLPYSMALDTGGSYTDQSTDLAYTLAITGGGTGKTGSGVAQSYVVTGNMAAAQSGTCAVASCSNSASTNKQRTLTITY